MTKEELKQEAKEWIAKNSKEFITNPKYSPFDYAEAIYLAGAEPREKQIQIDAEQIRALQKQNGELTDENERLKGNLELWESGACRATNLDNCGVVKELEAQIEKMKNCENCAKRGHICVAEEMQGKLCGKNKDKWELRR